MVYALISLLHICTILCDIVSFVPGRVNAWSIVTKYPMMVRIGPYKAHLSDIYTYICFEVVYLNLDSNKDLFVDTQVEIGI